MVAEFHRHNVRVLFPVMPWDTGTHRPDVAFWDAALRDMKAIGADGINGDTYNGIPSEFLTASQNQAYPLVLEPENHLGPRRDAVVQHDELGLLEISAAAP